MPNPKRTIKLLVHVGIVVWLVCVVQLDFAAAQEELGTISQAELQRLAAESANNAGQAQPSAPAQPTSLNFLKLLIDGGALMVPIAIMSLLVVAFVLERAIALRRAKIFPNAIRREIRMAIEDTSAPSPKLLFETSEKNPSAASRMLQDVLQKIGRPVPEIETAISEGAEREADYLYGNVRWLTLAAAVTPLIGLLGTVWGMIIAFYNTTQLGSGRNKAEFLAEGIYVALVTTLGGLAVAIPAAIFAHYFEGKISKMISRVQNELRNLVPRFEALEGKARYDLNARGLVRRPAGEKAKRNPEAPGTRKAAPPRPPARQA